MARQQALELPNVEAVLVDRHADHPGAGLTERVEQPGEGGDSTTATSPGSSVARAVRLIPCLAPEVTMISSGSSAKPEPASARRPPLAQRVEALGRQVGQRRASSSANTSAVMRASLAVG